jgi:hypothetical protein
MADASGSRTALETLIWLTNQAFDGDPDQSLISSIRDLRDEDWTALVNGGGRSITDILEHVAWAKWMYDDYAFKKGTLRGDVPPLLAGNGARSRKLTGMTDLRRIWVSDVLSPAQIDYRSCELAV